MPNIFKYLSPISILIGLAGAIAALALLWRWEPAEGVTIGVFTFLLIGGVAELLRRLLSGPQKTQAQTPEDGQ